MALNGHVIKSTIVGALGGLLFGFDTAVISGSEHSLTPTFHLSPGALETRLPSTTAECGKHG